MNLKIQPRQGVTIRGVKSDTDQTILIEGLSQASTIRMARFFKGDKGDTELNTPDDIQTAISNLDAGISAP